MISLTQLASGLWPWPYLSRMTLAFAAQGCLPQGTIGSTTVAESHSTLTAPSPSRLIDGRGFSLQVDSFQSIGPCHSVGQS
jgi:hypothetical protein